MQRTFPWGMLKCALQWVKKVKAHKPKAHTAGAYTGLFHTYWAWVNLSENMVRAFIQLIRKAKRLFHVHE